VIHALREVLGPDGTLVMPSWPGDHDRPFDRKRSAADADLGIVAQIFWQLPGVRRADHFHAFAAAGPKAEYVLQDPLPLPPHIAASPVGRVHDLDGQVLLLGVNHDADTTIHLAETMAAVPYGIAHHGTVLCDGRPKRVEFLENDHCCRRFRLVDDWLRAEGLQAEGTVGRAPARLVRARDVMRVVVQKLGEDPLVFLCAAEVGCDECHLARVSLADRAR
jgi:aminoglycoside N3'-acetyltransferase